LLYLVLLTQTGQLKKAIEYYEAEYKEDAADFFITLAYVQALLGDKQ
jgi:hypothetical protein